MLLSYKETKPQETSLFNFTEKDKKDLIKIARQTIKEYVKDKKYPKLDKSLYSDNIKQQLGAFVTLYEKGTTKRLHRQVYC